MGDNDELKVFRASKDAYCYSTNYCDLPEVIKESQKGKAGDVLCLQKPRGTLDQANSLKHELLYNEEIQVMLFKQKNLKVFKQPFNAFNQKFKKMQQRKLPNIFNDEQRVLNIFE